MRDDTENTYNYVPIVLVHCSHCQELKGTYYGSNGVMAVRRRISQPPGILMTVEVDTLYFASQKSEIP